jgi:hypothetical protein
MTLLDRFRTQPQKHPDPAVRLAHVNEIPLTERELIASIAKEDEDPRVRKAAVAKLLDPAALGIIARDDRDETVRGDASAMLRDIALEAFEGTGESDSLEAVDALTDFRALAQIARTAAREIVALRALSRLSDGHSLGSVARHAASEAVRRGAFERVRADRSETLAVAMNSEYKDTALAALELITDRDALEQIAQSGKNKSAAKRARVILREAEDRDAAEAAAAREEAPPDAAVRSNEDPPAHVLTEADSSLNAAAAPNPADADVASTAEAARAEAARGEERERLDAEAAERARRQAAADEEARRVVSERRHVRLAELIEVAAVAAAEADLGGARRNLTMVRREWKDLVSGIVVDEALAVRFVEIEAQLTARETEARERDARTRREALARLQQLLARVELLPGRTDLTLKAADRALRDIRTALASMPQLPSKQDYDDVIRRLKAVQTVLTPKAQELREADDWQRWANVGVQEQLCAKMEALSALEDPEAIAHQVHELQQQWKQAADVPRAQADLLWRRFKTAHDSVWARCEAFFAAQAAARAANLLRKTALCERAEALAGSTRWIETAEAIKKLQAEWKTIGPVSRGREKAIWDRFRTACDRFFTRRHEDLDRLKKVWAENFAKKEALCVSAEALADSSDWDQTAAALKKLQAEWKTIGPVKKSRSEAIWQRFRAACDRFFTRYAQRHDIARADRVAAREAICAELESIAGDEAPPVDAATAPPPDLLQTVRAIRGRWQQEIAARGVDPDRARALDARFNAASARIMARWPAVFANTDLDPDANQKRMESIVRRIEDLAGSLAGPAGDTAADASLTPATRLATMLRDALAANTIGGKVDEEAKWRAAAEEVRQAQASFSRIGHVPDATRRALVDRFQRASRRITERAGGLGRR